MASREILYQIDKKINSLKGISKEKVEEVSIVLNEIFELLGINIIDPMNCLNQDFKKQKLFVCIVLLRIVCVNDNLVWEDKSLRVKILGLISDNLKSNFRYWGIDKDDLKQKFKLMEKVRCLESDFQIHCQDFINQKLVTVSSIPKFMHVYIQHTKHKKYEIFNSFVDSKIINVDRIKQIFINTSDLMSEDSDRKIEAEKKLIKNINSFIASFRKNCNSIESNLVMSPFEKIVEILQEDLPAENKLKSADLSVERLPRKYPLNVLGEKVEIKLNILNTGHGEAQNIILKLENNGNCLELKSEEIEVGVLSANDSMILTVNAICKESLKENTLKVKSVIEWVDFEGIKKVREDELILNKQRSDIDWYTIKNPYSTQHVSKKEAFIGREALLEDLLQNYDTDNLESLIISGQKRVGKTSIGKILVSILNGKDDFIAIYVTTNEIDKATPKQSITELGFSIMDEISDGLPSHIKDIEEPEFSTSLSPLIRYLKKIHRLDTSLKFVIVIDEFDELPYELTILPTSFQNTFLANIRALIQTPYIGVVLIGGENMNSIKQHTQALNNVNNYGVDYFDKDKYWDDFTSLVRKPAEDIPIEYNIEGINYIYALTEGNPFYTKMICSEIFKYAKSNRISYMTKEVIENIVLNKLNIDINNINHFWLDCIMEDAPEKKANIEQQRIKLLLGVAELKKANKSITKDNLKETLMLKSDVNVSKIIESFVSRNILTELGNEYRLKPKLFVYWLLEKGVKDITKEYLNEEAIKIYKTQDSEAYVSDVEIKKFLKEKDITAYRDRPLGIAEVRSWLNQFNDNIERRCIFKLLENIKFYNSFQIVESLKLIHKKIASQFTLELAEGENKRNDLLLSSFGNIGKSGSIYARKYRQENNVVTRNVISTGKIRESINRKIKALVFVDDVIGTGGTAEKELLVLNDSLGEFLKEKNIKVFVTAICAYEEGITKVNNLKSKLKFELELIYIDEIEKKETCQNEDSIFYDNEVERDETLKLIQKYHQRIGLKNISYLGYKDNGLLIAFHEACPNNSLPIIWADASNGNWKALLVR